MKHIRNFNNFSVISEKLKYHLDNNKPIVEKKAEKVVIDKKELKRAIEKQKDFINGKFW